MKDDLRKKAGARLKMLITDFNVMSKQALAETLGVDPRSVHNWYQSMPPHRVREVSSKLGLASDYFEVSDKKLERTGITPYLGSLPNFRKPKSRITFEGTTTLALTRFISANKAALENANVRIETCGTHKTAFNVNGAMLSADAEGYIRSIAYLGTSGPDFIGGVNAVVEDHRLLRISFKALSDELVTLEGSSMPCRSDKELSSEGASLPATLLNWRMHAEALHYIARLPNAATFQILVTIIEKSWKNFPICESAFDALKRFSAHFVLYRSDRLRAEALIVKFLKDHAGVKEAEAATAYAIEALPFCTHSDIDARKRCFTLIDNVRHHRRNYKKLSWESHFAARVALNYLPFVADPDAFEIPISDVG